LSPVLFVVCLLLGGPKLNLFSKGSDHLVLLPCDSLGSNDALFNPVSFMDMFPNLPLQPGLL
jgi:hypothetical protein